MTYVPVDYWRERGKRYEREFVRSPKFVAQEEALTALLGRLKFSSVLEVGCGFGRIGALVTALRPGVIYTGIDISPDMLDSAREKMPDATLFEGTLSDFDREADAVSDRDVGSQFDLVLAVESLMHVLPSEIEVTVETMRLLSRRHIVTLDWTYPLAPAIKIAEHNFLHDYRALFGPKADETRLDPNQAIWHPHREFGRW
jgi:SAM-dependent methyltransferase